ncbi:hypothetical protein ABZ725_10870 [Streptomyces sp. NPDC006872]|uniref:hypothetical protein n=1 Tax=Streptomyces sp. NPDC006872 TaxID=3155720 RepID=UPI00340509BF
MALALVDLLASTALTARLGPVHVGASWEAVTSALAADPSEIGYPTRPRSRLPRLYGYGDLEISVCRCREVRLVSVPTWRETVDLPPELTGGTGSFPGAPSYADVVTALERAGCPWEPHPALTFGDQRTLRIPSTSAAFTFVVPAAGEPSLHALGLPDNGHECPPSQDRRKL